jgi:phosphohistidine phosphatase
MQLLIVRHGEAGDAEEFARSGQPDRLRPLTARGRKRMWLAARGLAKELPAIDLLTTSPYLRALQTAEILSPVYGNIACKQVSELAAGAPLDALLSWLTRQSSAASVAVVGHAPDLAQLATRLVCDREWPVLKIKKGGACLVTFNHELRPGEGRLRWLMDAHQLGRLGLSEVT